MSTSIIYSAEEVTRIIELYKTGLGSVKITKLVGKGTLHQIRYILATSDMPLRPPYQGRPPNSFPGIQYLHDFLDGILLGDGGLLPVRGPWKNSGLSVTQVTRHEDFLSWIQNELSSVNVPSRIYLNKQKTAYVLYTPRSREITGFWNRWYPKGLKDPPTDLSLTPKSFVAWYLGDGTMHYSNAITLYTNAFTFDSAEFLTKRLFSDLGVNADVREHRPGKNSWSKHPSRKVPIIYIKARSARQLFQLIGPCPVPSFAYKWPDQST